MAFSVPGGGIEVMNGGGAVVVDALLASRPVILLEVPHGLRKAQLGIFLPGPEAEPDEDRQKQHEEHAAGDGKPRLLSRR